MKYINISLIFLMAILAGCNGKGSSGGNIPQATPPERPDGWLVINPKVNGEDPAIQDMRSHAHALIESRGQNEGVYSIIVVDYFHYEFVFTGTKMSDLAEYHGYWIDFKEDFTYDFGNFDEIKGGGMYHYNLDSGKMIMVDDNPDRKPQEWTIMAKDDVIILVGSDYFGNNPRQIKLVRNAELPFKVS